MKTVLIITSSFPRYDGDFFGPWILDYAKELAKQEIKVIVVAPNVRNIPHTISRHHNLEIIKFNYWWPFKFQKLVHPPGMIPQIKKNPFRIFQIPFLLIGYIRTCQQIVETKKIDLVHCQWLIPSGFVGAIIKRFYKVPLFITSQGAELFLPKYHPYSFFTRWTIRNSNKIFPVSYQMAERLKKFGCNEDDHLVIPNAVDTQRFKPSETTTFRRDQNISEDTTIILTVRRLVKEKRVEDVINAFAQLENHDNVCLIIAGDGPERQSLESLVRELKIENNVIFLGDINNKDLPFIYTATDIYVLSSQQEGLSLSLLEAMSCECLTISTRSTGAQDVIEEGINGFLYEVGNSSELTQIIKDILAKKPEEQKRITSNARRHIVNNFSITTMVYMWIKEYNNILKDTAS